MTANLMNYSCGLALRLSQYAQRVNNGVSSMRWLYNSPDIVAAKVTTFTSVDPRRFISKNSSETPSNADDSQPGNLNSNCGDDAGKVIMTRRIQTFELLCNVVSSSTVMNQEEWSKLKETAATEWCVAPVHFESQVMVACTRCANYPLGRSLMHYLRKEGRNPNIVTLSKYLRLCADSREHCDEDHILEVFDELRKRLAVFDVSTVTDIIHGLCRTSRWRESCVYVDAVRLTCPRLPVSIYEDLATAAFVNDDFDYGWNMLEELNLKLGVAPPERTLLALLAKMRAAPVSVQRKDMLERLFDHLHRYAVILPVTVANEIKAVLESDLDQEWHGYFTSVSSSGVCQSCNFKLEDIRLDNAEFEELRSAFITKVIEGQDIYLKTSPYELRKFKRFVRMTAPYSVVLDGLNVAFSKRRSPYRMDSAKQLLHVAQTIRKGATDSRKLLILGRHHMGQWPRAVMHQIEEIAHVFFADNVSKDDPYMIYAAMCSGQGTYFVSQDLLRDHAFCLKDERLKLLFHQWQRGHQMLMFNFNVSNTMNIQAPLCYNSVAQISRNGYHIPFDDGSPKTAYEIGNSWLCLSNSQKSRLPGTITQVDGQVVTKTKFNVQSILKS